MLIVDIVLVILIFSAAVQGYRLGLIQTLGQLVGSVLGFLAARYLAGGLAKLMSSYPNGGGWAYFLAFVVIFLLVDRLIGLLFRFASTLFNILKIIPFLGTIHALLGAILGFAEGIVLVGASVYIILFLHLAPMVSWLAGSRVAPLTERAFRFILGYFL